MSNKLEGLPYLRQSRRILNVGKGNFVSSDRIVIILESGPLPVKKYRERALELNLLVDATAGKKVRSLIVLDSNHLVLSALSPETLEKRLQGGKAWPSPAELELEDGEFVS